MRVRARFRVRVRIRVRVRVRVGVRVSVRVRVKVVIKPIPLSRYPFACQGILFGVHHGEEFRREDKVRNTPIIKKSHYDSLFNLFLQTLVLRKSIGGRSSQG